MEQWEVLLNNAVTPATLPVLQQWIAQGVVRPETQVRKVGHPWVPAGSVPVLFPPGPIAPLAAGQPPSVRDRTIAAVVISLLLVVFFVVKSQVSRSKTDKPKTDATHGLLVEKDHWKAGGFGSIGVWEITFYNPTAQDLGNIKYRTEYWSETGKIVSRGGEDGFGDRTIQKIIRAGERRTLEVNDGFIDKETHRAYFEIVSCEVIK